MGVAPSERNPGPGVVLASRRRWRPLRAVVLRRAARRSVDSASRWERFSSLSKKAPGRARHMCARPRRMKEEMVGKRRCGAGDPVPRGCARAEHGAENYGVAGQSGGGGGGARWAQSRNLGMGACAEGYTGADDAGGLECDAIERSTAREQTTSKNAGCVGAACASGSR